MAKIMNDNYWIEYIDKEFANIHISNIETIRILNKLSSAANNKSAIKKHIDKHNASLSIKKNISVIQSENKKAENKVNKNEINPETKSKKKKKHKSKHITLSSQYILRREQSRDKNKRKGNTIKIAKYSKKKHIVGDWKTYIDENFKEKCIYLSDIEVIKRKFNLIDNPEGFKIIDEIKFYVGDHNHKINIASVSTFKKHSPEFMSWDDITFYDGYFEVKEPESKQKYRCNNKYSNNILNRIKLHFKIKFETLEIQITNGKVIINDPERFNNLLQDIKLHQIYNYVPSLEYSPKQQLIKYFKGLTKPEIKRYLQNYKQEYINYLCIKQLGEYKIQYTPEYRVNFDSEEWENAFIFTVSIQNKYAVVILENTLESRSSQVFYVPIEKYEEGIKDICAFFTSDKINKREFIINNKIQFKQSGIIKTKRLYHTNYKVWKQDIDNLCIRYT